MDEERGHNRFPESRGVREPLDHHEASSGRGREEDRDQVLGKEDRDDVGGGRGEGGETCGAGDVPWGSLPDESHLCRLARWGGDPAVRSAPHIQNVSRTADAYAHLGHHRTQV